MSRVPSPEPEELGERERQQLGQARKLATASMVLGLLAWPLTILVVGLAAVPISLALGYQARITFKRFPTHAIAYGADRATLGITSSWILFGLALSFVLLLLAVTGGDFNIND